MGTLKRRDMPLACFDCNGQLKSCASHWKHAEGMSLPFVCNLNGEIFVCSNVLLANGVRKKRGYLFGEPRCVMWCVVWVLYLKK